MARLVHRELLTDSTFVNQRGSRRDHHPDPAPVIIAPSALYLETQ
jgi:hypothetical protein